MSSSDDDFIFKRRRPVVTKKKFTLSLFKRTPIAIPKAKKLSQIVGKKVTPPAFIGKQWDDSDSDADYASASSSSSSSSGGGGGGGGSGSGSGSDSDSDSSDDSYHSADEPLSDESLGGGASGEEGDDDSSAKKVFADPNKITHANDQQYRPAKANYMKTSQKVRDIEKRRLKPAAIPGHTPQASRSGTSRVTREEMDHKYDKPESAAAPDTEAFDLKQTSAAAKRELAMSYNKGKTKSNTFAAQPISGVATEDPSVATSAAPAPTSTPVKPAEADTSTTSSAVATVQSPLNFDAKAKKLIDVNNRKIEDITYHIDQLMAEKERRATALSNIQSVHGFNDEKGSVTYKDQKARIASMLEYTHYIHPYQKQLNEINVQIAKAQEEQQVLVQKNERLSHTNDLSRLVDMNLYEPEPEEALPEPTMQQIIQFALKETPSARYWVDKKYELDINDFIDTNHKKLREYSFLEKFGFFDKYKDYENQIKDYISKYQSKNKSGLISNDDITAIGQYVSNEYDILSREVYKQYSESYDEKKEKYDIAQERLKENEEFGVEEDDDDLMNEVNVQAEDRRHQKDEKPDNKAAVDFSTFDNLKDITDEAKRLNRGKKLDPRTAIDMLKKIKPNIKQIMKNSKGYTFYLTADTGAMAYRKVALQPTIEKIEEKIDDVIANLQKKQEKEKESSSSQSKKKEKEETFSARPLVKLTKEEEEYLNAYDDDKYLTATDKETEKPKKRKKVKSSEGEESSSSSIDSEEIRREVAEFREAERERAALNKKKAVKPTKPGDKKKAVKSTTLGAKKKPTHKKK
jgi:hypothetical protein